jgi:hypothetical protein
MISFLTFFLGLTAGHQLVAVNAAPTVATVRFLVDQTVVCTVQHPPWECRVDFGPNLTTHTIVAIAEDRQGAILGESRQEINVPRSLAEAALLFRKDQRGLVVQADVSWDSVSHATPERVTISLDGHKLHARDPMHIPIPPYDPATVHDLAVVFQFSEFEVGRVEGTFGGLVAETSDRELTAVPLLLTNHHSLRPAELTGRLFVNNVSLSVTAVEAGPARVLFVRTAAADEWFNPATSRSHSALTGPGTLNPLAGGGLSSSRFVESEPGRFDMMLRPDDQIRFLYPTPTEPTTSRLPTQLFPGSPYAFTAENGGIPYLLRSYNLLFGGPKTEHVADAVAVAGLQAASGNQPRAVVLLCTDEDHDSSQFSSGTVRKYLREIAVPLFVWCIGGGPCSAVADRWGHYESIGTIDDLRRAVSRLRDNLKHQAIAWVDGAYLLRQIAVRGQSQGWKLLSAE